MLDEIFSNYIGAAETKKGGRAFFFVSDFPDNNEISFINENGDSVYFQIYGDKHKKKDAPEWIKDLERDWNKNEKPTWIPYNSSYIWSFKKYLVDNVDGLRLFDKFDDEIDVKDVFSDNIEY